MKENIVKKWVKVTKELETSFLQINYMVNHTKLLDMSEDR